MGMETIKRINQLNAEQDAGGKLTQAFVEMIKVLKTDYNECIKRQNDLLNKLKVSRKDRLQARKEENASILNLVALWQQEKSRKELLHMAKLENEILKKELNRLSTLEDMKARIYGIDENETLNG